MRHRMLIATRSRLICGLACAGLAVISGAAGPATAASAGGHEASISGTAPALHMSGNRLVDRMGRRVVLHGVDRSGGEYACVQGWGIWDGPMNQASVSAMKAWRVTAVRVPLNEACWNGESYVNASSGARTTAWPCRPTSGC